MNPSDAVRGALACPRCTGGELARDLASLLCHHCGTRYPLIGGVPCLLPDPSLWRELWTSRIADYLAATDTRMAHLRAEAELADLLPRTRNRVLRVLGGLQDQRAQVQELLSPLFDPARPRSTDIPGRPESRDKLAVLECYENLFRDWVWGEAESASMRGLAAKLAPAGTGLGRLAVYGAGAGRLAVDVHETLAPELTLAIDINPLPLLVAQALTAGDSVDLPEFPLAPHSDDETVMLRHLPGRPPARDGLAFLFADALSPPFAAGSLNTVLTSWFVDSVAHDFRLVAAAINRVLAPGGHWINLGPLRFENALSRVYSIQEVHEIVAATGFDVQHTLREDVRYFDSPASGSRRIETAFGFLARKSAEASAVPIPPLVPPWVVDPRLPVPVSPVIMNLGRTSMFTASAISLVDGTRSLVDVAAALAAPWGLPPEVLLDQLRAFFAKLPP